MAFENLRVERDDRVLVVTIARPKVLNALNARTLDELSQVFDEAVADDGVRVIVLTGEGDRAFVAGADINELAVQSPVGGREHARRGQALFTRIERLGKPVIAAVNGFALGGGCELAMACTLRIAADTAEFGQPEINLGLIPGYAGTQRLPRLVGRGRALELLLAGESNCGRRGVAHRAGQSRGTGRRAHDGSPRARGEARRQAGRSPPGTFSKPSPGGSRCRSPMPPTTRPRCSASSRRPRTCAKARARSSKSGSRPSPESSAPFMRIALVVSRYHAFITDALEAGARAALVEAGVRATDVETFPVPGAFELAQAAQRLAEAGDWSAVVCLGCLIRGETSHFDYIAQAAAQGITRAAQATGIPVAFGLLTTNTADEALARAGAGSSNKGREAALAAVEMVRLYARIDAGSRAAASPDS